MRIALPVAGGNLNAATVAQGLVEDTGFIALAAGDFEDSWRQQPGTPAYCTELTLPQLKLALQVADKDRAPQNRDVFMAKFMAPGPSKLPPKLLTRLGVSSVIGWQAFRAGREG